MEFSYVSINKLRMYIVCMFILSKANKKVVSYFDLLLCRYISFGGVT